MRVIEARVYLIRQDPSFRPCKDAPEKIQQTIAGCKMKASKASAEHRNQVAAIVYGIICNEHELEVTRSRWEMSQNLVENERTKILCGVCMVLHVRLINLNWP